MAFCQRFEVPNKNVGAAAGVRLCGSLSHRPVAILRSAPMWGRLALGHGWASFVEKLAFFNAKTLKIGASGGAAQAAEAMGGPIPYFPNIAPK